MVGNIYIHNIFTQIIYSFYTTEVEEDYVGPELEDGKVTVKFMEDLMNFYKEQKKLHRKYAYKVRENKNNCLSRQIIKIIYFQWGVIKM